MQRLEATKQGGPMTLVTVPKSTPGEHEVCVRTKAIGLNPVDGKNLYHGEVVSSWPMALGHEIAGVVESVGAGVTAFKPGDEVFGPTSLFEGGVRSAAFQEFVIVKGDRLAHKPTSLTFEEAASIPICYITAAAAILVGLEVPLPGLGSTKLDTTKAPRSILVVGGSSGCGAHAIQLLRMALGPSATIVATSSPQHHGLLTAGLGASGCIARAEQGNAEIVKAASPGGAGFDAIIDCVGAVAQQAQLFDALRSDGPKILSEIVTTTRTTPTPDGIKYVRIMGAQTIQTDGGSNAMPYIANLIEEGKYKLPIKVEVVGEGLESIEGGIEKLEQGVSGTKLVVTI